MPSSRSDREPEDAAENRFAARMAGFGPRASRRRFTSRLKWLAVLPFVLLAAWIAGLATGGSVFLSKVAELTYLAWVLVGFGAPAIGAAIRRSFDTDPLLPELLASPMREEEYLAALRGPVLLLAFSAFLLALLPGAGLLAALRVEGSMNPPPYTLHLLFRMMGFGGYPAVGTSAGLAIGAAFLLGASFNFACGVHLHASILAGVCQIDPKTKARGAFMTAGIVAMLPAVMFLAYMAPVGMARDLSGTGAALAAGTVAACVMASVRVAVARGAESRMKGRVVRDTARQLGFE